jgi:2,4-diketo-3-deoxy-L-fuconate hydrolase
MRLARFDGDRIGVVTGEGLVDTTDIVAPLLATPDGRGDPLIRALPAIRIALEGRDLSARPLAQARLEAPVRHPSKIVAAPINYRAHVAEMTAPGGAAHGHLQTDIGQAGLFLKAVSSLVGPAYGIALRFPERRTDYEAELVVVVGQGGSDILEEDALGHVAGYCVGLDITLRGPEDRSFRKSIDTYSVIGPWLTTPDEIVDPDALTLTLDLNGERRQTADTGDMVYGVARLVAFASSFYTLHPGDLIFTGTPQGVGAVKPGDRIAAEVSGLGRLETVARAHPCVAT